MVSYYSLIVFMVLAGSAGFVLACLLAANKVNEIEAQLTAKKDQWCFGCDTLKRLKSKTSQLVDRESYIKMLEERVDRLQRSNAQLGAAVQRRVWKKVQA